MVDRARGSSAIAYTAYATEGNRTAKTRLGGPRRQRIGDQRGMQRGKPHDPGKVRKRLIYRIEISQKPPPRHFGYCRVDSARASSVVMDFTPGHIGSGAKKMAAGRCKLLYIAEVAVPTASRFPPVRKITPHPPVAGEHPPEHISQVPSSIDPRIWERDQEKGTKDKRIDEAQKECPQCARRPQV